MPYCDIEMPTVIKLKIDDIRMSDSYCLLLFTQNSQLVNYVKIGRQIADFSYLEKICYSRKQQYKLGVNSERRVFVMELSDSK
jgi:hypothetical protein